LDLLGSPAPIEPLTTKIFDPRDFAPKMMHKDVVEMLWNVVNLSVKCAKFFEAKKGQ
jgi:hypothetical protein